MLFIFSIARSVESDSQRDADSNADADVIECRPERSAECYS